jgi:hypothetical protein
MWNRGNAVDYNDPSGYCAEDACLVEGGLAVEVVVGGSLALAVAAHVLGQQEAATRLDGFATGLQAKLNDTVHAAADAIGAALKKKDTEHTKGARGSTKPKHQEGQRRKKQDYGGEKGDDAREWPRRPPPDYKGAWPPKPKPAGNGQQPGVQNQPPRPPQ